MELPAWPGRPATASSGAPAAPGPLATGDILDGAVGAMRRHPGATLGLAAAIAVVQSLAGVLADALTGRLPGTSPAPSALAADLASLIVYVVDAALSAILVGMIVVVVFQVALGRDASVRVAWDRVRSRFWRLFGAAVLAGVLPFLGLVAFIVPGVYLWAALAFAPAVVVVEDSGVWRALRRSRQLVRGAWWRTFGIYLLAFLIAVAVAAVLRIPGGVLTVGPGLHHVRTGAPVMVSTAGYTVSIVLGTLGRIVTTPFVAGVVCLLYLDRRIRGEGFDPTLAG